MNKILHVLISKKGNLFKNRNQANIFTLNEYILSDEEKENINHLYPDPQKTSFQSEQQILKSSKIKIEIYKKLEKLRIFNNIKDLDELIEPFLELKLSRFFYLESIIPNFEIYFLVTEKSDFKFSSKVDLILAIDKIYSDTRNKKDYFLNKFYEFNYNIYNSIFLNLQARLLKIIFNNNSKNLYFFSHENAYFVKSLKSKFKNKESLILHYTPTFSYLKIILLLLKQLSKIFLRKSINEIGIFLLPENKIYNNYEEIIFNINNFEINGLDNKLSSYILKQLYPYIFHTTCYKNYLIKLFKDITIQQSFFHTVRFPDLFSLSRVLNKFNTQTYLISHGSHTIQNENEINYIASKSMGIGLAYTNEKGIKLLSQSIYCDDFLEAMKFDFLKINRVLKTNFKIFSSSKENKKTKILYVGTVKNLGERRYYFESSAEFFQSINQIYKKLQNYKDLFELIIRIRDVKYEIDQSILNNAFKDKKDLIKIGNNDNIYKEIENSDCLISFSSTTLEEGIYLNKPVMCYGLPKYNHLKSYEKEIKEKTEFKLSKNLILLENKLGRKFVYKTTAKRQIDLSL